VGQGSLFIIIIGNEFVYLRDDMMNFEGIRGTNLWQEILVIPSIEFTKFNERGRVNELRVN